MKRKWHFKKTKNYWTKVVSQVFTIFDLIRNFIFSIILCLVSYGVKFPGFSFSISSTHITNLNVTFGVMGIVFLLFEILLGANIIGNLFSNKRQKIKLLGICDLFWVSQIGGIFYLITNKQNWEVYYEDEIKDK